jgi:hypothetical protein
VNRSEKMKKGNLPHNVNPGLINTKRLVNWGGYHKKVLDEMTIGGVPP